MCRARSYVWLNQFADQFVPILALLALRVVVGVGDAVLKRFSKPKKGAMQARLLHHTHVFVDSSSRGLKQTACTAQRCRHALHALLRSVRVPQWHA